MKVSKAVQETLNKIFGGKTPKLNGWVKLAELSNGVSICRHIKKDYIAHFFLN